MPDLRFPLEYTQWGSVALVEDDERKDLSQAHHILSTIPKERVLYPALGFPLEFLFSVPLPEIIAERVKLALAPYILVPFNVTPKYDDRKVAIQVFIGQEELVVFDWSKFLTQ